MLLYKQRRIFHKMLRNEGQFMCFSIKDLCILIQKLDICDKVRMCVSLPSHAQSNRIQVDNVRNGSTIGLCPRLIRCWQLSEELRMVAIHQYFQSLLQQLLKTTGVALLSHWLDLFCVLLPTRSLHITPILDSYSLCCDRSRLMSPRYTFRDFVDGLRTWVKPIVTMENY